MLTIAVKCNGKESNEDNALLITIGSDGKADCGIRTMSEVNDLIH